MLSDLENMSDLAKADAEISSDVSEDMSARSDTADRLLFRLAEVRTVILCHDKVKEALVPQVQGVEWVAPASRTSGCMYSVNWGEL